RVLRVDHQVDDTGPLVHEVNLLPGLAAVGGLVHAAVGARAVQPAQGADVDDVRVLRGDDDPADLVGLVQGHVLAGLAAVAGLVDAVAVADTVARVVLAGADPDDVLVGGGDGHVADGDGGLLVEAVLEGDAVVDGPQQAAGGGGDEPAARVGLGDGDGGDAAAHGRRADRPPGQGLGPLLRQELGDRAGGLAVLQLVELAADLGELPLQLADLLLAAGGAGGLGGALAALGPGAGRPVGAG